MPSRVFRLETAHEVFERGNKIRSASFDVVAELSEQEIGDVVSELSIPFGEFREQMVLAQMNWRNAFARPGHDENLIKSSLQAALNSRGLDWTIKQYPTSGTAWIARAARAAWDALSWQYAALNKWVDGAFKYTVGIQDAYKHGAVTVLPTSQKELGWSFDAKTVENMV